MGSFEENSFGWQLRLLQQRVGEWLELLFAPVSETDEFSLPAWLETLAVLAFWTIAFLLIVWGIWRLVLLLSSYTYRLDRRRFEGTNKMINRELSLADWLARSQKFRQQGNYREACLCLYQAMLHHLHDRGIAGDLASRTDGEYLHLIQQLPQPQPYQRLLVTHQQLCFGNTEASLALFEQCQQAYQAIDQTSRESFEHGC